MPSDVWGYIASKGQWRRHGDEAIGVCPACRGGQRGERCLSVNISDGRWVCNRKNNCGQSGGFRALQELYGDRAVRNSAFAYEPVAKVYRKPQRTQGQLGDAGLAFLRSRGLDDLTIVAWGCGQDTLPNLGPCVTWPCYNPAGEVVNIKYRAIGEKQFRNTGGAQKLPIGIQTVKGRDTLILVEGELDAMSGYQLGLRNIVSVPNGTGDSDWIEDLWPWLSGFRQIIVALDADEAGSVAVRKIVKRLGAARCSGVALPGGRKDLNECLTGKVSSDEIQAAFSSCYEFPVADLRFAGGYENELLAEKRRPDSRLGVLSGWTELDQALRGFRNGELTVWSGYNGSGKSTVLGWFVNRWASQQVRSCVVSLELPPKQYLKWLAMQGLGDDWDALPENEVRAWLRWVSPHFCMLNHAGTITLEKLLEVFAYAAQRYNCKQFVADNLMRITGYGDTNDHQKRVTSALKDFANEWDCHVHLVAHPKKPPSVGAKMDRYDISGTGDIPNLADNVLLVNRTKGTGGNQDTSSICLNKNREHGTEVEFQIYVSATSKFVFASGGDRSYRAEIFAADDDIPEFDSPPDMWAPDPGHGYKPDDKRLMKDGRHPSDV